MKTFSYLLGVLFALSLVQVNAQATGSHYTADYSSGWTITDKGDGTGDLSYACNDLHNGTFYLAGNAAYFYTTRCSRELRASRAIPAVSNTTWTMDFKVVVNPYYYPTTLLPTNSPAVVLASLTADNLSLKTSCTTPAGGNFCTTCGTYPNTNMDAIWAYLIADPPEDCAILQTGIRYWIGAGARDGNGTPNTTTISIPSTGGTYYVRLQRTNATTAVLSVFSNSNFTGHLSGSPQCLTIPGTVSDLDVLTHEVNSEGVCSRTFNGIVADLKIDNNICCPLSLNPSFTCPTSLPGVQSFTVNGSASTSGTSVPIGSHLWIVEECDANGNQFGPVWYGWPGISGAPSGNYTISPATVASAGLTMRCGHYYRVSLVLMNCGNPWAPLSKVMYIRCPTQPNFNIHVASRTGAEYTIEENPEDNSGYEFAGFSYSHTLEELDDDGTSLYTLTSPDCWQNYPDAERFRGFVSTGPGTYSLTTTTSGCVNPGRFLIGQTYRLTTTMHFDGYDDTQYSAVMSMDPDGNLTVIEDDDLTMMTVMGLNTTKKATEATIFPNPGTGVFTVELGEEISGLAIEVTDVSGKKVKTLEPASGTTFKLDLTGFARGIYTVNIVGADSLKVTKKITLE